LRIGEDRLEPFHESHLAGVLVIDLEALLSNARRVTETAQRIGVRIPRVVAVAPELGLAHLEVEREFIIHFLFEEAP
jgi:hypothetical protein